MAPRSRANSKREGNSASITVFAAEDDISTRATKRRKKADSTQPDDNESAEASTSGPSEEPDGDHLVSLVTQHLLSPKEPNQASKDHSNQLHESKDGVKAYAKIAAQDWTFYVTKLEIHIGRNPDPVSAAAALAADPSLVDAEDAVHIDLGPSKTVSRQHAMIFFNSEGEEWHLRAMGRNGVKVDGQSVKGSASRPLKSGNVIDIAGMEMMFVLPTEISTLHIADTYLARVGLLQPKPALVSRPMSATPNTTVSTPARSATTPSNLETPLPQSSSVAVRSMSREIPSTHTLSFQQPIAPAPANYRRPGTPTQMTRNGVTSTPCLRAPSTPGTSSYGDVDLSLEENAHIKPQYSYAQMITQAILNTPDEKLNLNGIYNYILEKYAYYRKQPAAGWQNSIRHNLSLNKAFDKVARSIDEPGKGMKWQLVPESREDMIRSAHRGGRGGHRGSSVPSSPSQLNYITQGPRDMAASCRKRRLSPIRSPGAATGTTHAIATPDRSIRRKGPLSSGVAVDGSPLPRPRNNRKPVPMSTASSYQIPSIQATPTQPSAVTATPSKMPISSQQTLAAPRSPFDVTSSFMQEDGASFVTPAPLRINPRLAPPSTVQKPSQGMPTSSPAPFWKYMDISGTPMRGMLDLTSSPSRAFAGLIGGSSPPRLGDSPSTMRRHPETSVQDTPSIRVHEVKAEADDQEHDGQTENNTERSIAAGHAAAEAVANISGEADHEEVDFDLTKGFQSIGEFHSLPKIRG